MGNGSRRVGIKDVALAAGVSVTTVSHALNGKGRLPDDTREHVRRVASELGYRPNATARNLVVGKTGLLALTVSQPDGLPFALSDFAYFAHLMTAATRAALGHGYALVLTPPNRGLGEAGVEVDGAIVVDPVQGDPVVDELRASGIPIVTTGRIVGGDEGAPWVDNDHVAGVRSVLAHLERRGARRIALLTSPTVISYTVDVERAYREWCSAQRMEPLVEHARADLTESAGFAAAMRLLDRPDPPDAIFATYDRLALGALLAAGARGVDVPGDLLLAMTATDSDGASRGQPAVTSVNLYPEQIGGHAAELLVDLVEGREPAATQIRVPTRVVARASTRRAGATAPARARARGRRGDPRS
jgi:DNA-binding LacI/PurR family transcriptional regulator